MKALRSAFKDYVLEDLLAWRKAGHNCCLLTLIKTTGASPRPLGSQMIVREDGHFLGMITGGCAEASLALDAQAAIKTGKNHTELYGKGSRFKDITLPCGSGLYIYFDVTMPIEVLNDAVGRYQARKGCALGINYVDHSVSLMDRLNYLSTVSPDVFIRPYRPKNRVIVVGQGPIIDALEHFLSALEIEIVVFSPDVKGARTRLIDPKTISAHLFDRDTALVLVFHEHSFETDILHSALNSEAYYIGALGSRKAHQQRLTSLTELGFGECDLERIKGPIGLDIGAKTPPEIALSITAELIAHWRKGLM